MQIPQLVVLTLEGEPSVYQLYANVLARFVRDLTVYEYTAGKVKPNSASPMTQADKDKTAKLIDACDGVTGFLYMPGMADRAGRVRTSLDGDCTYAEIEFQLRALREITEDELARVLVLYMPPGQAVFFYKGERLLGEEVLERFPQLAPDIDEAAKCLGSGRYTAAVFHLMRVMEVGVQEFGVALGVSLLDKRNADKTWHNIVEECDKAIRAMDKGNPRKKEFAEVAAALMAVKIAWRNEVMHPKASYTDIEAKNIIGATETFMAHLAALLSDAAPAALPAVVPSADTHG